MLLQISWTDSSNESQIDTMRSPSASNEDLNLKRQIQEYQKKAIINALKKSKGVQKKAASLLGVKPTTLNEMIKRLDIDISNMSYWPSWAPSIEFAGDGFILI